MTDLELARKAYDYILSAETTYLCHAFALAMGVPIESKPWITNKDYVFKYVNKELGHEKNGVLIEATTIGLLLYYKGRSNSVSACFKVRLAWMKYILSSLQTETFESLYHKADGSTIKEFLKLSPLDD